MFFDNKEYRRLFAKWIVSVFAICILLYLAVRNFSSIGEGVSWLFALVRPILIGGLLALVLNVPLKFIENKILSGAKHTKVKRPLAITLSLLLIIGIILGIVFLVIPELIKALTILGEMAFAQIDRLSKLDMEATIFGGTTIEDFLENNVNWAELKTSLQLWIQRTGKTLLNTTVSAAGSVIGAMLSFFMSLVFAIYMLSQKENLSRQFTHLFRVWLPDRVSSRLIHMFSVCNECFANYVAGQTLEAFILGGLCTAGMLLLRLPYAPMVGVLVGATALLPVVGAYIGGIVGFLMILTESPTKALIFVIYLAILQQVEGNLIYPRVVGSKLNLPAIWVLAAITVGGNLFGMLGMLLGVPVFSAAYTLFKEATQARAERIKKETPTAKQ